MPRSLGGDAGIVPGVTGDTGTGGACGTTSGLLGLKFGVGAGGRRGGTWATAMCAIATCATAPAASKASVAKPNRRRRAGGKAKLVPVPGVSRNSVVLGLPLKYWNACDSGKATKPDLTLAARSKVWQRVPRVLQSCSCCARCPSWLPEF